MNNQHERIYRTAYLDGVEATLDDLEALMRAGVEPKIAFRRVVTHTEGSLAAWRRRFGSGDEHPPRLTTSREDQP